MNIVTAKEKVICAGHELLARSMTTRTWGNISCRVSSSESSFPDTDSFVITPSGKDYTTISPDEIVEISLADLSYDSKEVPSMEYRIHADVYRTHPEANFVLYTTQINASAVSAMELKRIAFDKDYPGIGKFAVCAEYALSGSLRLSGFISRALKETIGNAIILKNHGALCFGKSMEEALNIAETLEMACGEYLKSLGVEPWDPKSWVAGQWNSSPALEKYMKIRDTLPAYLEDFAQLVGPELKIYDECSDKQIADAALKGIPILDRKLGCMCFGDDKEALAVAIEKNCMAALAALGVKPLDPLIARLMRGKFRVKYEKLR